MKIGKGKKDNMSFYTKKIKAYVKYLRDLNNVKINELLDEIDNEEKLFNREFINKFFDEWCDFHYNLDITEYLKQFLIPFTTTYNGFHFPPQLEKIGKIVLKDNSISNKDFITYLYKNEIALILGKKVLDDFHKAYYSDALGRQSYEDLVQMHKFKYLHNRTKRRVAISLYEILKKSDNTKDELLEEWFFSSLSHSEEIDYLELLKLEVSEQEYIELLKLYAKLDLIQKVKLHIFNELYDKGVLEKNLELRKRAFEENVINHKSGVKFFNLVFNTAKEENDIDTIKWMYSLYPYKSNFHNFSKCLGRKEVSKFLNLPLYDE